MARLTGIPVFHHTQATEAMTWTINHNLGHHPTHDVSVLTGGVLEKIYPLRVTHVDDNTLMLEFSIPRSGFARLF
jgi:hypothetical protein